eukprot:6589121-Prymnesium_polylepis.2
MTCPSLCRWWSPPSSPGTNRGRLPGVTGWSDCTQPPSCPGARTCALGLASPIGAHRQSPSRRRLLWICTTPSHRNRSQCQRPRRPRSSLLVNEDRGRTDA